MINYAAAYFNQTVTVTDLNYFTLGARPLTAGSAGLDSSDQNVLVFDTVSGITAYRSGLVLTNAANEITHQAIDDINLAVSLPTVQGEAGLRLKLAPEQLYRLRTGYRPYFATLHKPAALITPRLAAAIAREVSDYRLTQVFLNSVYNRPGLIFMRDGRLNAHKFPGPPAYDRLYRLAAARGVRVVGLAKTAHLLEILRPYARAVRRQVGDRPFAIPIVREQLALAHPGSDSAFLKTLRHGASNQAYGGAGAVRFALSISGDELGLVEFNLYDLNRFRPLVHSGQSLAAWAEQSFGRSKRTVFSWDILRFVTARDWTELFIPTLESLVYTAYAGDELGLYPRALGEAHNRVKLRWRDLEEIRRFLIAEFSRQGLTPEQIPIQPDDPHKTDPEIVNYHFD